MDGVHENGASRPGEDPTATPAVRLYPVELSITFGEGAGVTRAVSREEVRFVTDIALAAGQRLTGALHFPGEGGEAVSTVLRYVARVTSIWMSDRCGGGLEVEARFERLEFGSNPISLCQVQA
jgi:hypothetical protein